MGHREQLHSFDSYVAQIREQLQANEATVSVSKDEDATVITVRKRPKPAAQPEASEQAESQE